MRPGSAPFHPGPDMPLLHTEPVGRRVTCPTFVGREAELRRLAEAAEAATVESQIVLVGGDAGVGKTRLVDELRALCQAAGRTTVIGGCIDLGSAGVGYAPLIQVVESLREELGPGPLDALLARAPDGDDVDPGVVLNQVLAFLTSLGEQRPGAVVVFEDMHWADASTRDLVAFLARMLRTPKVLLVLTYREDDLHRRHPLRPLLAELARNAIVESIALGPMSRSELTLLLAGVAGTTPTDRLVDDVMARSEGNPFYAEELLALDRSGPLPATLRDAILARIARLEDSVQAVLRDAAVLDGAIDDRLLAAVTGRPVDAVAGALREAVAQQILVGGFDGCRFRHALLREALQDDLLPGERQRLHHAVAAVVEADPVLVGLVEHVRWAVIAHHAGAANDQPKTFTASVRAGLEAEKVGALAEAGSHFERALELWPVVPDARATAGMDHASLYTHAARSLSHVGAAAAAAAMIESALAVVGDDAPPERRSELYMRLGRHLSYVGDLVGSTHAHEQAVRLLADRPPSEGKAVALAALGRQQIIVSRYLDAAASLREAVAVNATNDSPTAQTSILANLGFVLVHLGQVDEGIDTLREALRIAEDAGLADERNRAHQSLCAGLIYCGRYVAAVEAAAAGADFAASQGMSASAANLEAARGFALMALGEWDEADELLARAALADGENGASAASVAARLALWRGRLDDAAKFAERALLMPDGNAVPHERLAWAGEVAAAEGRYDDARRLAAEAIELVSKTDDLWMAGSLYATALQIEAASAEATPARGRRVSALAESRSVADAMRAQLQAVVERVVSGGARVLPESEAWLAVAEAEHGRLWGRSDPDEWAAIAARWDDLGTPYYAAVARYEEADAVLRARGSRSRALTAARSALATAQRLSAEPLVERLQLLAQRARLDLAPAPSEVAPVAAPSPLAEMGVSPRELEVLELLARGRTNRQIAEQLYISEKTASVHVTNLLRKLSVTSRIEAAAIAQQMGLGA